MINKFTLTSGARAFVGVGSIAVPLLVDAPASALSSEWFTGYDCLLEFLYIVWKEKKVSTALCTLKESLTTYPAPVRVHVERESPVLVPYSDVPPYQGR
jgi:hypothetical protein